MTERVTLADGSQAQELGLRMFDRFEYTKALEQQEKLEIIEQAMEMGRTRAGEIRTEFQTDYSRKILLGLGISIVEEVEKDKYNTEFVKFAEYCVKQKKILINLQALRVLGKKMNSELAEEIILCHELYHYFERERWGKTSESFRRKVRLFSAIPVRRGIMPAGEIAANAFAKEFLKLDFEPQMIERIYFENK